jgi:hypothetical protein
MTTTDDVVVVDPSSVDVVVEDMTEKRRRQ